MLLSRYSHQRHRVARRQLQRQPWQLANHRPALTGDTAHIAVLLLTIHNRSYAHFRHSRLRTYQTTRHAHLHKRWQLLTLARRYGYLAPPREWHAYRGGRSAHIAPPFHHHEIATNLVSRALKPLVSGHHWHSPIML